MTQSEGPFSVTVHSSSNHPEHSTSDTSLLVVDKTPPSSTKLSGSAGRKSNDLSWDAASDENGISKYLIYRDGSYLAQTSGLTYKDGEVTRGTTYAYYVIAEDLAGNQGPQSNTVELIAGGTKGGGKPDRSEEPSTCTDSDGGKNLRVKGVTQDLTTTYTDECYTTSKVLEGKCTKGKVDYLIAKCTGQTPVCFDGACI